MNRTPFGLDLRRSRALLVWLGVFTAAYAGFITVFYTNVAENAEEFEKLLDVYPKELLIAFGIEANFAESFMKDISLEQHLDVNARFAEQAGGITLHKIVSSTPTQLTLLGAARKGATLYRVSVAVEATPPHKIASVGFRQPLPSESVEAPPTPEAPPPAEPEAAPEPTAAPKPEATKPEREDTTEVRIIGSKPDAIQKIPGSGYLIGEKDFKRAQPLNVGEMLRRVPGVGPLTAMAFVLTIEDPTRFRVTRDVGPYLSLTPERF